MLYFYKQVKHPVTNMHVYMHYFFMQLFAEVSSIYNHSIFIHPDFQTIVDNHDLLDQKLYAVFTAYMELTNSNDKLKVQKAYCINNEIQQICDKAFRPIKFSELHVAIQQSLLDLYGSEGLLYKMLTAKNGYQAVKNRCGSLKGHFEKFRIENELSICPFCGMENLLTEYDDAKNEYDHYLSKGDYPFCSINFDNLTPICDYCNKAGNKGQKDIPFQPRTIPQIQNELYFPYSCTIPGHAIQLKINATTTNLKDPDDWILSIDCTPTVNLQRKTRWLEIYNIESRYKAKIAGDSYRWKDRIVSKYALRCKKNKMSFADFKIDILDDFVAFLECNNGILMKTFDEFIMNDPNCEANLAGVIF